VDGDWLAGLFRFVFCLFDFGLETTGEDKSKMKEIIIYKCNISFSQNE